MFMHHKSHFAGREVVPVSSGLTVERDVAYCIRPRDWMGGPEYETDLESLFEADGAEERVEALVIGYTGALRDPLEFTEEVNAYLPSLRALFWGDVIFSEREVSWLEMGDLGPLLTELPDLEILGMRAPEALTFRGHARLRELTIESGGLPGGVLESVLEAELPSLERLEIWTGSSLYGSRVSLDDLRPLLYGRAYPELRPLFARLDHLGLCNSELADAFCEQLQGAPLLQQIRSLDLSRGTLSDAGVQALVAIEDFGALERLDLRRNYILDRDLVEQLRARGLDVDDDDQRIRPGEPTGRYVETGE